MSTSKILNRLVYLSLALSLVMIGARMIYSGESYGNFLIWNLFLAWIPFALSVLLRRQERKPFWHYCVLLVWLLFLPNAPYIITDLFHLRQRLSVPYWYDLLLLFWAAWNGLLLSFISLLNVERYLVRRFNLKTATIIVNVCIVLCAFGIYAGRFLRWNSWDVVAAPKTIVNDVRFIALNPEDNLRTWGVTFFFSIVMILGYRTIKQLQQATSAD